MSTEQRLLLAFGVALCATVLATPIAIWVARRTGFLDHPRGYKGHARSTPYLGGTALGVGIALAGIAFGGAAMQFSPIALCAVGLWLVGTADDHIGLAPLTRVFVAVGVAVIIWATGLGWELPGPGAIGLTFTVLWVVGLINAYNLMDNMDGAAATVGGVSAGGVALIAALGGEPLLAALALSVSGACAGFLLFNLRSPARIFMGDGGSMPLGFLIAATAMSVPVNGDLGVLAVVALAPVAALPILDVFLVMFSRRRRGVALTSGGRDHLTHRLRSSLRSPRVVALLLASCQAALCVLALGLTRLDPGALVGAALACLAAGAAAIWALERPALAPTWTRGVDEDGVIDAPAATRAARGPDPPILVPAAPEHSN